MKSHLNGETVSLKQEKFLQAGSQPIVSTFLNTYSDDDAEEEDEEDFDDDEEEFDDDEFDDDEEEDEEDFDDDEEEDGTLIEV